MKRADERVGCAGILFVQGLGDPRQDSGVNVGLWSLWSRCLDGRASAALVVDSDRLEGGTTMGGARLRAREEREMVFTHPKVLLTFASYIPLGLIIVHTHCSSYMFTHPHPHSVIMHMFRMVLLYSSVGLSTGSSCVMKACLPSNQRYMQWVTFFNALRKL